MSDAERDQIAVLRREVAQLRRSLAEVVKLLGDEGVLDERILKRRLAGVAVEEEDDVTAPPPPAALNMSVYRGSTPQPGTMGCAVCGSAIGKDDPELTAADGRRVCPRCFQR